MTPSAPDPNSPRRDSRHFDELIAVVVALLSIGSIAWWSASQQQGGFDLSTLLQPTPSPAVFPLPAASPSLEAVRTPTPAPVVAPLPPSVEPSPQAAEPNRMGPAIVPIPAVPTPVASPTPAPASPTPVVAEFSDVPTDFWATPFIAQLAQRGVIQGLKNNTFQPNRPITRAEFATMLQNAFEKTQTGRTLKFKDISDTYWASPAIADAVQMGFMSGYPDGTFQPNQVIPRVQAVIALATGLNLPSPGQAEEVLKVYQDGAAVPRYATDRVAAATAAELVVNHPDPSRLEPAAVTTRADAAALIYQALVKQGRAEKIPSNYITQPR